MAVLDLNSLDIPVLELTLKNTERTTLRVKAPTEGLINEFEALVKDGLGSLQTGDRSSVAESYDLVARLISCNMENITITGDELRTKYNVDLWALLALVKGYVAFINEIKDAKN